MASDCKPRRDWIYLLVVGVQLVGMLLLDLVAFYPKSLWQAPSAPLHFLVGLRKLYVSSSGDPYFSQDTHEPWFDGFLYIEGLVQLPLAAFVTYQLASRKPTKGSTELAALAIGCFTAMGSAVVCFDLWHMEPERVSEQHKTQLLFGTYMPFLIIPALMGVDMYLRLLDRIQHSSEKAKTQ